MSQIAKFASGNATLGITMRCPSEKLKSKPVPSKNRAGNLHVDASGKIIGLLTKSSRGSGKGSEISFGKNPTVRHGADESKISVIAEDLWQEFYRFKEEGERELILDGFVTHKIQVKEGQEAGSSSDPATLLFQTQLAALNQEKKARQTGFDKQHLAHVPDKRKGAAKNVKAPKTAGQKDQANLKKGLEQYGSPIQVTPLAMSPQSTFTQLPASLTASMVDEKMVKMQVLRNPLLHLLAIEAIHISTLARKLFVSRAECRELLSKHGKPVNGMADHWVPTDRAYKLLDVWKFAYIRAEDRERAINNAISAFDRLRLSREDLLWQMLLPEDERGKGVVLSRLNLHLPQGIRPTPTPTQARLPGSSPQVAGSGTDSSPAGKSTPAMKKPGRQNVNATWNPATAFSKKKKQTGTPTRTKKISGPKTQSKKSENENFKSAEYVHSSDEDSSEELFKELPVAPKTATATPKTPTGNKRKADEAELSIPTPSTNINNGNKRHQSSPPSNPSTATPTSHTNIDTPSTNSGQYSPKGFELDLVLKATEYEDRYPLYQRLYNEVMDAKHPSEEKVNELERMHLQLKALKRELVKGSEVLEGEEEQ